MNQINHNYLPQQFAEIEEIIGSLREVVGRGDFTLGREVGIFEAEFAKMCGVKHAIGVANGTDALYLAYKSLGVKNNGDEVITTPYSFYATTAMIRHAGGRPVFADVGRDFNIDPDKIRAAITPHTVGIACVHWAGRPCNMAEIMAIAEQNGLWVVEDCAHAPLATYHYGKRCGSFGSVNTFSMHPLKNVNVWGDGGVITTDNDAKAEWLRKARNHGMTDRDTCEFWSVNSRLDTVQAVVASHVLAKLPESTAKKQANLKYLDTALSDLPGVEIVAAKQDEFPNGYLYSFHAENRDVLQSFLLSHGVDAKVHYPTPLHLQPAAAYLGYKRGDFPMAEWCADTTISLPIHEFITDEQLGRMASLVRQFYEAT